MSKKTPLLLLPGLLCDRGLWQAQAAALEDIAEIDVADLSRDDSLPAMARRVLAAAPARFAVAGLSMGGYLAQEIMRQAPERVSRLAILDSSARADTPDKTARRHTAMDLARKDDIAAVARLLWPDLVHPARQDDQRLLDALIAMARRIGRAAFLRQEQAIMARPDGRGDLARIAVPTLLLCGREDALTPLGWHEEMASLIPGAELVVIEECGHLSTMERPGEVTAAMRRWLLG
jgi:pimeloyl-ACP methyl ester carboxylesterase